MPVAKHVRDPDSEDEPGTPSPSAAPRTPSSSAKKAKTNSPRSGVKKSWSAEEEAAFLAAIDSIAKKHLWNEVKGTELGSRGGNGIRSHWEAMYKKLKK